MGHVDHSALKIEFHLGTTAMNYGEETVPEQNDRQGASDQQDCNA